MGRLTRELADAQRRVRQLEATLSGDGNGVFRFGRMVQDKEVILPESVNAIRARFGSGFELQMSNDSFTGGGSIGRPGFLQVMTVSHHGMQILPQSGNVVHIGPGRS